MRILNSLFLTMLFPLLLSGQTTISYNFEDGSLEGWTQSPADKWEINNSNPLSGELSLRHKVISPAPPSGITYVDRISRQLPSWNATEGSVIWRFLLRHNYAPSGSNHWAVFLTSSLDAEGMISTENTNGYAIGVNLKSTDDILRLYRVDAGDFVPILTTSINWETQVGANLSAIGAVEVERKTDGTFVVKVSTTGSFLNMESQGLILDLTYPFQGYFGVYYSYTSANTGRLTVDDISLIYKQANINDDDVNVLNPNTQVAAGFISSLATSSELAEDVLRFVVADGGSDDGLPTYITKLRFAKVDSQNAADWSNTIAGIKLRTSTGVVATTATYVLPDAIEIDVHRDNMIVNNGASREFTLSLYLKPENIVDGATIQLQVDSLNHGWETFFEGSTFANTFPAPVTSNLLTIRVFPTHMTFTDYPRELLVNEKFNVSAMASDITGNRATTFASSSVNLSLAEGEGVLTPTPALTTSASGGIAIWNNITYSGRDVFILAAAASGLESATTENITVINDTTTLVLQPDSQIEGDFISSTCTTLGKAVEVFRFKIQDQGENDGLPTNPRQIFIKRAQGDNLASFNASIAGVLLKVNGEIVPIGNPHILMASISIPLPKDALVIPDGDSIEVSFSVYLRTSGLVDGANLKFMIDSVGHNLIADADGSAFEPRFPSKVISNAFTIDVTAIGLAFSKVPQYVGLEESFSVEVSAVDATGNLDLNAVDTVSLSKNSGDGWLTIPTPNAVMSGGKATWGGLKYVYYSPQPFNLLASTPSYNDVLSPLIYCSDRTSTILQPSQPLANGVISSMAVEESDAVEVFRFRVSDRGNTDNLPTRITQMVFRSLSTPTDVSLNKAIMGVKLWVDGETAAIASTSITANTITLTFDDGALDIPDGNTLDVSLGVYLKKGGQIDGSTITLHVPVSGHGWQTSPLGSGFPAVFEAGVVGPVFEIEVVASAISFVEQPFVSTSQVPIALAVAAIDDFGNIDINATGNVILSLDYGPGTYQTTSNTRPLQNGIATWSDVLLGSIGRYRFKGSVSFSTFQAQAVSQPIWNGGFQPCIIDEDFDTDPISFSLTSHWSTSTVSPIDGDRSLKHALSEVGGESSLPIPLNISNLGSGPVEWAFVMRNGNWDPSADNTFWFVLVSDTASIKLGDFNGYAVGVNLTGTSDLLSLWRVTRGQTSQVIIQSTFDWDESETVGVKVTRTPNGEWSLWFQPVFGESTFSLAGQASDTYHTTSLRCGPVFKYTSSRAGEFWLDNLSVCRVLFPPVIQSAQMLNLTSVDIVFSSPVNQTDAADISKYTIKTLAGVPISIIEAYPNAENHAKVSLRTDVLPNVDMKLTVRGIRNVDGTLTVRDSVNFGMGATGTFGSVIINEIMARPSPAVGLPAVEYIELYNRTATRFSLKNWRIRGNDRYANIPDVNIEPFDYVILCGTSGASAMSEYGTAVGVTSFPTLLVGGMFLGIYNENNQIISWVEYSDTWYQDDQKKAGGYSLERIDPNNLIEGKSNWIASRDTTGGTPGRENSVRDENPDITPPRVVELKVLDPSLIEVGFSEPMDSLSITLINNYSISPSIGSPIWANSSGPKYSSVTLTLPSPLQLSELYYIYFDEAIIDFSGNVLTTDFMPLAVPQEPSPGDIIINEVLFNPYTGGVDFVELYNRSDKTFDLNKLWIANRNRTTLALNEYYAASDTAWLLFPQHYAVLTINPALVEQFYYVENPAAMVWTKRLPAYPNDEGYVLILGEFGAILDEFKYNEKMHFTLLSNVKGVSLERIHPDLPTEDKSSWQSAAQVAGFATPTAQNSQYQEPTESQDEFTLTPQVFSPDGDGFDDVLLISYNLPDPGYFANIMVFDSRGRRIKRLASNLLLGTSGSVKWDGSTDEGRKAKIGAYIIFIEVTDLNGNVKRYKKTCVVATKFGN